MKNRKALEDQNNFQSGLVGVVKHFVTDLGVTILTAAVMHSEALNESKLNPWVGAQKYGSVICVHCEFMDGQVSLQLQTSSALFFFNEKIVLKHRIMYLAPPEQEE